jgi:hypothetical protein
MKAKKTPHMEGYKSPKSSKGAAFERLSIRMNIEL